MVYSSDNVNGINCRRANTKLKPYTGTINFFAFSFSDLESSIYYESLGQSIMPAFSISKLPIDSVSLCNSFVDLASHLQVKIQVFPSGGDSFNRTGVIDVGNILNRQLFPLGAYFGPFAFIHDIYEFPGIDEYLCCRIRTLKTTVLQIPSYKHIYTVYSVLVFWLIRIIHVMNL